MLSSFASRFAARAPVMRNQVRNFAAMAPVMPLSMRMDGLMAKVTIALLIFFVPQDAALYALILANGRARSKGINSPQKISNVDDAVEAWKQRKGLENAYVSKGSRKCYVDTQLRY